MSSTLNLKFGINCEVAYIFYTLIQQNSQTFETKITCKLSSESPFPLENIHV